MNICSFRNQVFDLIRSISGNLEATFQPIMNEYKLTTMQVRILMEIKISDCHNVGSLGKVMGIQGGNASSMCKNLEKEGLLRRIRDTKDERIVNLVLSEQGEHTIEQINQYLCKKYEPILNFQTSKDLQSIMEGMQNLNKLLIKINEIENNTFEIK